MAHLTVPVTSGLVLVLYLIWRLIRNYILSSPLNKIPGPPSGSVITGNVFQFFNHNSWKFVDDFIETYGPVAKCHGFYGSRMLHVYDPKAMHNIYLKDQDNYSRGEKAMSSLGLLLGPGLLATQGPIHKKQRKMLNPVFSGAHMRNLTPLFYDVADRLRTVIESQVKDGPKDLDVLAWMGRAALELVGRGGLGYSFDDLVSESRNEFAEAVKALKPAMNEAPVVREVARFLPYLGPAWFRRFLLHFVPIPKIQRLKVLTDTLSKAAQDIYLTKKAAIERGDADLLHSVGEGKDIMSVLLRENMKASEDDRLPEEEVLAQMGTFILAGVDTTSNALSRILHLLCLSPDAQAKLRTELREAQEQYGRDIPYDELCALPYLDAVCRETLRLHAPVNISARDAIADTVIPLSEPLRCTDGAVMTEVPVPKGTTILLNLRACNTNKALWGEDACEWKPERWLRPLPKAVEDARIPGIYANLMTFISGGHSCMYVILYHVLLSVDSSLPPVYGGFKFSQLEMKIVLAILVSNFQFELSPDKPIFWNFSGIAYPVMSHKSSRPEMYLRVSLASR